MPTRPAWRAVPQAVIQMRSSERAKPGREVHLVEGHHPAVEEAPGQGLGDRLGLLVDLLEHEVGVAAPLRLIGVPGDLQQVALHRAAVDGLQAGAAGGDVDDLPVVHHHDVPGVVEDGGDVAGQEHLAVAEAYHQRADHAHRHDAPRLPAADDHQGVGPLGPSHRPPGGLEQVAPVLLGDEVGQHLRVGLRGEGGAARGQFLLQGEEVLDDPVVDHGDLAAGVGVGVGVVVARGAVGGPAGVPDAGACRPPGRRRASRRGGPASLRPCAPPGGCRRHTATPAES